MPLGKLTQKQITAAFSILSELQNMRKDGAELSQLTACTNRFYTLVPHDFGVDNPPLLDNDEIINQKIDMLNNLMDIEIAYKLLESTDSTEGSPIDAHYEKLNAAITVLDKDSEEFANIKKYVENSHAETHRQYSLIIEDVFKVERQGEASRFKKFRKLPNHMLLWHGSRVTNFAGILSQGLRIAPPEAPSTGYMFGKGIYFADSVSKSANYCMTSKKNNTGLLLLCEVALGVMHELKQADFITKLPAGKHSTKGIGRTQPDPSEVATTPSKAIIPLGKGKPRDDAKGTSLLYNEYIVYDVNQVQIQYLVRMKFKY